ncbi:MAG: DUF4349 domain-containing protein [Hymenobacteraceae bacterium]|nr:DUF4349 domain-containing protein [Hymenobacteraceae bacterium]MDX5394682.1 DUF4349 domain-containing protein [Hymenobacteraceae bacterium]MDX5442357.1 DUF4349 domain-containing protein [Hymenobacteraceae bacterium]MDX5510713.1 DUF4349 domain-containing protein [Hymenobacteraceae bacterium]
MNRLLLLFLLPLLLFSCDSDVQRLTPGEATEESIAYSEAPPAPADKQAVVTQNAPAEAVTTSKIIKNARLRFEVKDFKLATNNIEQAIQQHQAYVESAQEIRLNQTIENHLQIRVPASRFETLLQTLLKQGTFVDQKEVSAVDVTQQYVDVEARLRSKKAIRARYLELLQQAKKVEDILKIENELRVIQEEIEATEARLQVLQNQVSYSTIHLQYYQQTGSRHATGNTFLARVARALEKGWDLMVSFVIGLLHLWPFLLLLPLVIWLFRKLFKLRKKS